MLIKRLLLKKIVTLTLSVAMVSGSIVGLVGNKVQAKELTKNYVNLTSAISSTSGDFQDESREILLAPVINSNDLENIPGMISVYRWATVDNGINLNVYDQPNGSQFNSIAGNTLVDVYDTYVDSNGSEWALVKYMVPGTGNAQRGWVNFVGLTYYN